MRPNERTVSFYDLCVESRLYGQPPLNVGVPTTDALHVALEVKGAVPYSIGNNTLQTTIADWQYDRRRREHYLIFNRADASLQDIPLKDIRSGASRMAGKAPSEGIDLTAHVLIKEGPRRQDAALMLMTGGSSLPVGKVQGMLTKLFRTAHEAPRFAALFHRDDPSGAENKRVRVYSTFQVSGHQNALLTHILRGGGLEGIDLISDADEMLDEEASLMITSTQFQVVPLQARPLSLARLRQAIGRAPKDIDKARVRYKPPGSSKVESHTFPVDALDLAFVRKETVRFNQPIQPRYEEVSMAVIDKLRDLVAGMQ